MLKTDLRLRIRSVPLLLCLFLLPGCGQEKPVDSVSLEKRDDNHEETTAPKSEDHIPDKKQDAGPSKQLSDGHRQLDLATAEHKKWYLGGPKRTETARARISKLPDGRKQVWSDWVDASNKEHHLRGNALACRLRQIVLQFPEDDDLIVRALDALANEIVDGRYTSDFLKFAMDRSPSQPLRLEWLAMLLDDMDPNCEALLAELATTHKSKATRVQARLMLVSYRIEYHRVANSEELRKTKPEWIPYLDRLSKFDIEETQAIP